MGRTSGERPERVHPVALYYDDDGYVELTELRNRPAANQAMGLMGRQVAGKGFLDGYFKYGRFDQLVAVMNSKRSRATLAALFQAHPANRRRSLRIAPEASFHELFREPPLSRVLHFPCPPFTRYAWARQHIAPHAFALSGITHTISSTAIAERICELVSAPYQPYDALVCISRAAEDVVRSVSSAYADFLRERYGGEPRLLPNLERIPLGVDTEVYCPATPEQRREVRGLLGIDDDEMVVLFVGRLSYTGKVHPFPTFAGLEYAARRTGRRLRLVMSGWAASDAVRQHIVEGASAFAPSVRTTIVDGTKPEYRFAVWRSADIFTSLTDNVQETLSQVVIEAMACGLPVVATDWDGCRDQVVDGETGFLVPARAVAGSTTDLTSKLVLGALSLGEFLADANQAIAVDVASAGAAYTRLVEDAALRRTMGRAGRERVLEAFTWKRVVHAFENLWAEQESERQKHAALANGSGSVVAAPSLFPPLERSFRSYPAAVLDGSDAVRTVEGAAERLPRLLAAPITSYRPASRVSDPAVLASVLEAASKGCAIGVVDDLLSRSGVRPQAARATVAWLLKYGLLETLG